MVIAIERRRIVGMAAAALVLAAAAGYGGWRTGRSDLDRVGSLERRVRGLESSAATLASEKDRLKADRDRLETLLAASDATPAACANAVVSTLDAPLTAGFIVEYPCGWSVLEQPMQIPPAGSPRAGLIVDHLFFSPFPISLQPRSGPPAEITLDAWYDDPAVEGELPSLADWLTEARGRFTRTVEHQLKTRSGIPVVLLEGAIGNDGEPREALLYVWEHTDEDVRRIYEAFALEPSRTVRTTIGSLLASFRFPGG
jgi:hypothetical protein